ncbi:MAG: LysE family transporter, partial [Pseudomonadota bacterium]
MTFDTIVALAAIAFTMSWTPGPNNVMLTASGAAFGLLRTVPHAFGVAFGFPVMLFLVAMGIGGVFEAFPWIAETLSWLGFAAMLWFGWKIATSSSAVGGDTEKRAVKPLTFLQAAAFQW